MLVNLPQSEINDFNRLMFHIERMWFYHLDHLAGLSDHERNSLVYHGPTFVAFVSAVFDVLEADHKEDDIKEWIKEYNNYKRDIPVAGCAVIDTTPKPPNILMVQPAGCKSWTVPRGKQNLGESLFDTATRETHEESGYPIKLREGQTPPPPWVFKTRNNNSISIYPIYITDGHKLAQDITPDPREVNQVKWIPIHPNNPPPLTELSLKLWPILANSTL
jgi:ADP-ribose pyrophosphatase YjhB (NUDIX family)